MNTKLAVVVVGGAAFLGGAGRGPRRSRDELNRRAGPATAAGPTVSRGRDGEATAHALADRFQAVIKQVSPSVVAVDAVKPPQQRPDREGQGRRGIRLRRDGEVPWRRAASSSITNNHVVGAAEPGEGVRHTLRWPDLQPSRIWADPESDITLLQLDDETLPTVELADSDRVRRGQWVLAFGSPFGLNQTVTHGIISATDRGQINLGSTIRIKEFLQTDAAINPGSSGGPLVDLDGRVVGHQHRDRVEERRQQRRVVQHPANMVKRIAGQLIEKGSVTRGYLGVQLASTLEPAEALRLGLVAGQRRAGGDRSPRDAGRQPPGLRSGT